MNTRLKTDGFATSLHPVEARTRIIGGFTLVELLVAMVVFAVIMTGIFKVYEVSSRSYRIQDEMAEMQQSVRMAKLFIERDVRMAGCGLGEDFYFNTATGGVSHVLPLDFADADGATGTDKLTINYIDYDADSCDDVLPQLTLLGTMPASSSVAEVVEDLNVAPYDAWDHEFVCSGVTYGKGPSFKEFTAIITSPDGKKSDVVWVTMVEPADPITGEESKIQNHPYPPSCGSCNKTINEYPAGSIIRFFDPKKLIQVVYSVTVDDGIPILRREVNGGGAQPIAEFIEDLQFSFGLDTNGDDEVDTWINHTNLNNTQKQQVRLVDFSILGRSENEHRGFDGFRPAVEDHAAGTPDSYRRKLLTVSAQVRNMGL